MINYNKRKILLRDLTLVYIKLRIALWKLLIFSFVKKNLIVQFSVKHFDNKETLSVTISQNDQNRVQLCLSRPHITVFINRYTQLYHITLVTYTIFFYGLG